MARPTPARPALSALPVETWGQRFRRARRDVTLGDAAENISQVALPISYGTIVRLEQLVEAPTKARQQIAAVLLLLSYGYDPAEFGLGDVALPRSIDINQVAFINAGDTDIARQMRERRSRLAQPVAC